MKLVITTCGILYASTQIKILNCEELNKSKPNVIA